jgi:hypothetical protein
MHYVGLDIHTTRISICVLDQAGQLVRRCQARGIQEMLGILKGLPDRFEVCYEASCGYGHYHVLLQPLAAQVVVAHPGQLRLIFRSRDKNDRKDAERLAKLLYLTATARAGAAMDNGRFTCPIHDLPPPWAVDQGPEVLYGESTMLLLGAP